MQNRSQNGAKKGAEIGAKQEPKRGMDEEKQMGTRKDPHDLLHHFPPAWSKSTVQNIRRKNQIPLCPAAVQCQGFLNFCKETGLQALTGYPLRADSCTADGTATGGHGQCGRQPRATGGRHPILSGVHFLQAGCRGMAPSPVRGSSYRTLHPAALPGMKVRAAARPECLFSVSLSERVFHPAGEIHADSPVFPLHRRMGGPWISAGCPGMEGSFFH